MFVSTFRCFPGFQVKYSCGVSLVFFGQNSINYNMLYGFRLVLVHVPILTRNGPKDLIGETGRCLTYHYYYYYYYFLQKTPCGIHYIRWLPLRVT